MPTGVKTATAQAARQEAAPRAARGARTRESRARRVEWRALLPSPWEARLCELEMRLTQLETENHRLREDCEQLERARASQSTLHDSAPFGWVRIDRKGMILDLNRNAAMLLGLPKSHLLNRAFQLFVTAQDRPRFLAQLQRCRESHQTASSDLVLQAADRSVPVQFSTAPLLDRRSRVREFELSLLDITARSQAEAALRESEQGLRALIGASPHPIQFKDADGCWLLANPAMLELFELTGVDYRRKNDTELAAFAPFYRPILIACGEADRALLALGRMSRNDMVIARSDGSSRIIDFIKVPIPHAEGWARGLIVLGYDITERRKTEAAVRESETLKQAVMNSLTAHIAVIDRAGNVIAVNEAWIRFACENGDPSFCHTGVGVNYLDVCRSAAAAGAGEADQVLAGVQEVLGNARESFSIEYPSPSPKGERWFLLFASPLSKMGGGAVISHMDITERKQAELARAQLAAIVESSLDAIIGKTMDGIISSWNKGAERMFGYSADEIVGRSISVLIPPDQQGELRQTYERLKRGEVVEPSETIRIRKDGRPIQVALTISPIKNAAGIITGASSIMRDITERKRLEAEILRVSEREQQRIGHDLHDGLGQQLTAIELMCQSLTSDLAAIRPELHEQTTQICRFLREAITQTRALAHGLAPFKLDANGLQVALAELAQTTSSLGRVQCRFLGSSTLLLEEHEAVANLYRIAQEAVHNAVKHGHANEVTIRLAQTNGAVQLKVSDDGKGLPQSKEQSQGMGLQVMKHRTSVIGADLEVESKPGKGVTVTCTLRRKGSAKGVDEQHSKGFGEPKEVKEGSRHQSSPSVAEGNYDSR